MLSAVGSGAGVGREGWANGRSMLRPRGINRFLDPIILLIVNLRDDDRLTLRKWVMRWVDEHDGTLRIPRAGVGQQTAERPGPIDWTHRRD